MAHFSVALALDNLSPDALKQLCQRIISHIHDVEGMDVVTIATDAESGIALLIVEAPRPQSIIDGARAAGLQAAEVREVDYISPTTVIDAFGVGRQSFDPFWKHARGG